MSDLKRLQDSLNGIAEDSSGARMAGISQTWTGNLAAAVYLSTQGLDVSQEIAKKDPDLVSGSRMVMLSTTAERLKQGLLPSRAFRSQRKRPR